VAQLANAQVIVVRADNDKFIRMLTRTAAEIYVFFKHEDTGKGPVAAARLHELMAV